MASTNWMAFGTEPDLANASSSLQCADRAMPPTLALADFKAWLELWSRGEVACHGAAFQILQKSRRAFEE
jgi:hypothetical protein